MLQAYISNDNQHLKRFDKQKIISAAVYWEMQYSRFNGLNAGEKYVHSKECRGVYLFSLVLLMCDSYSEHPFD